MSPDTHWLTAPRPRSSGFNSGSLGGRRPGPPAALVPLVLGQVYQVIDCQAVSGET